MSTSSAKAPSRLHAQVECASLVLMSLQPSLSQSLIDCVTVSWCWGQSRAQLAGHLTDGRTYPCCESQNAHRTNSCCGGDAKLVSGSKCLNVSSAGLASRTAPDACLPSWRASPTIARLTTFELTMVCLAGAWPAVSSWLKLRINANTTRKCCTGRSGGVS